MAKALPLILVTDRPGAPADKSILRTPSGEENQQVVRSRAWVQALVRAGRTWGQGVAANILTAGTALAAVQAMGFPLPENVLLATTVAVLVEPLRTSAVTFIHNMLELTAEWDTTKPKFRA